MSEARGHESSFALTAGPDDDPIHTGYADIVGIASWAYLGSAGMALLGSFVGGRMSALVITIQALAIVAGIVFVRMARRGHTYRAATGMILSCWAVITGILAAIGTIRAPTLGFYLLTINLAGMLWGRRGFAAMFGLCSATVAALVAAQSAGWLPQTDLRANATQWISATTLFVAVGLMTHLVLRLMNEALDRAEIEIRERRLAGEALEQRNEELRRTLSKARALERLLPICRGCRKIREDDGSWKPLERVITARTGAAFTHGICPDCRREYFPENPAR